MNRDAEHLRILSILYYVWAGLGLVFSCVGGVYIMVVLGVMAAAARGGNGPPVVMAGIAAVAGGMAILFGLVMVALSAWTGKCLADRHHHTLCVVVAALSCLSFPLGTGLGIFSLIVLTRPSAKALFAPKAPGTPA